MPQLLHIVTKPQDPLAEQIINGQREKPENRVEVVDLNSGKPDYKRLVERTFAADSVNVW